MKQIKVILTCILTPLAVGLLYGTYTLLATQPLTAQPGESWSYQARTPARRQIKHVIHAQGKLTAPEFYHVGSMIIGIIEKMFYKENDRVKKGDLIALVDDGKADTEVRATKANFETAQAYLAYYTAFYARQQALHESHFISDNDFERYGSELTAAKNRVDETRALHEQAILLFDKKKIRAPADGIVIKRNVTEGEPVSYYPPDPFIYTIATDISTLNAEVEIPAGVATHLKIGMEAGLAIAGQQGSRLKSRIAELTESSATNGSGIICRAKLPIHNGKKDLRPGMVVDAKIPLAKPKEVLTIAAEQCTIRPELIRELTRTEGMAYRPLSPEDRARYRGMNDYRIVWVQAGQAFIEKPVKVKALETGDGYEVLEGLSEKDRVVESVTPGKTGK